MLLKELQEVAKELGIKVRGLKKAELEDAIAQKQNIVFKNVDEVREKLRSVSKGEARKIRKSLRANGFSHFAGLKAA